MRIVAGSVLIAGLVLLAGCQANQPAARDGLAVTSPVGDLVPPFQSHYQETVERNELIAACLREHGFEAEAGNVFDDGTVAMGGPALKVFAGDQEDAAFEAERICDQRYPEPEVSPPTDRQMYEWQLYTAECLGRQGYDVIGEHPPPSFEAWKDAYSSGTSAWDPWVVLMDELHVPPRKIVELYEFCPPF